VCRRVTGNEADAADAAQEAMIAIVRGLHNFDGRSSFSTWIYRIATNASLDELRRRQRRPLANMTQRDGSEPFADAADPHSADRIDSMGDRFAIDAALANLAEEFRVAVVLRDIGDLDYAEIAQVLDIPVGTVKSRIARGRVALAASLGQSSRNQPSPSERPTATP
jgi:RNA polymerase sigma-70 factor (ECF subfamily)